MPIFEYACDDCGQLSEYITSFDKRDDMAEPCPFCDGVQVWAGLSAPVVVQPDYFGVVLQDGTRVKGGLERVKRGPKKV